MHRFKSLFVLLLLGSHIFTAGLTTANRYKGGEIYSNQSYKYERYEMRMRAAKGSGVLSPFFLYKDGSEINGTFWEEIDIEIFGKNNATQWQRNLFIGTNHPTSTTDAEQI